MRHGMFYVVCMVVCCMCRVLPAQHRTVRLHQLRQRRRFSLPGVASPDGLPFMCCKHATLQAQCRKPELVPVQGRCEALRTFLYGPCIWTRYLGITAAAMFRAGYYSRDGRPGEVGYLPTLTHTTTVWLCCRLMIRSGCAGMHAMYSSTSTSPFSLSDLGASHAPTSLKAGPFVQVLVASRARVVGLTRRVPTVELPLARWICELVDSCHCRPV
jgi:hypothetical protein